MGLKENVTQLKLLQHLTSGQKQQLLKDLSRIKLLTPDHANAKTAKNAQFSQYESVILHLSPADLAFKALGRLGSLCPMASQGCKASCLNTAGRGKFDSIQLSRLRKSLYFILFKEEFMRHLVNEIRKLETKITKKNKKLVVRLNGTSDIAWEGLRASFNNMNIFETFPNVQFYDYTKMIRRLEKIQAIPNYYVIFSASESNHDHARQALKLGFNVAMVFNQLPSSYKGFTVLNGDLHDFRFLDGQSSVIVGLKTKGKAKKDLSGFVRQVDSCLTKVA